MEKLQTANIQCSATWRQLNSNAQGSQNFPLSFEVILVKILNVYIAVFRIHQKLVKVWNWENVNHSNAVCIIWYSSLCAVLSLHMVENFVSFSTNYFWRHFKSFESAFFAILGYIQNWKSFTMKKHALKLNIEWFLNSSFNYRLYILWRSYLRQICQKIGIGNI